MRTAETAALRSLTNNRIWLFARQAANLWLAFRMFIGAIHVNRGLRVSAFVVLQTRVQPYLHERHNRLEVLGLLSFIITGNIGLVFGREGNGLSNQEISLCDVVVSIPTHESYPILNVTHAAAIIFYEIFKKENMYPSENMEEASKIEKESLISTMNEIIDKLDYPPHKSKNASTVFRRVLGRSFISGREAHTLKGALRRIKMRIDAYKK